MNTFTARVERGTGWWVIQLLEEPGLVTQTRRLDQVEAAVRDALSLFPELTDDPSNAKIELVIPGSCEARATRARQRLEELRREESSQLDHIAALAQQLADSGYSYRDIAFLLGISFGRVSQILKERTEPKLTSASD